MSPLEALQCVLTGLDDLGPRLAAARGYLPPAPAYNGRTSQRRALRTQVQVRQVGAKLAMSVNGQVTSGDIARDLRYFERRSRELRAYDVAGLTALRAEVRAYVDGLTGLDSRATSR